MPIGQVRTRASKPALRLDDLAGLRVVLRLVVFLAVFLAAIMGLRRLWASLNVSVCMIATP